MITPTGAWNLRAALRRAILGRANEIRHLNNQEKSHDIDARLRVSEEATFSRSQVMTVAVILLGYSALSYYSDSVPTAVNLAAGLSVGPVAVIGLALAWRWMPALPAAGVAVLTCLLLYRYWEFIRSHYSWSNLVQQAGVYGLVAASFLRSLSPGVLPLCTQLAQRLHGPLTAAEVDYMRKATLAWALFYLLLTFAIVVLFFATSPRVWSFFVNFATFGLIALMFLIEHLIRRRVAPDSRRGSTLTALRQFLIG